MKRTGLLFLLLALIVPIGFMAPNLSAKASGADIQAQAIIQGAMLYDNWFAALGVDPPDGHMPLWSRQNTNTRSGADTWRCVTCHGWDYQGNEGAYRSGSNFTGFPGVLRSSQELDADTIIDQLNGKIDPAHNFSPYLSKTDLNNLAIFLTEGLIDDDQFIDPITLKVLDADQVAGKALYERTCQECHGADGTSLTLSFDGMRAGLGTLANADPWRFLHKTRFGTPGTVMPIGYELGWTPENGRDVLAYAQTMPSGFEFEEPEPVLEGREAPRPVGGPASGFWGGILTALGAMATSLGFAVLLGGVLIGVLLVIVWLLRGRK